MWVPMKRRALLLVLSFAMSVLPASVFAADWDVQTLMKELGASSFGSARFSEKKYIAILDSPIEQSGTLAYSPGHLEKITLIPRRERVTISGDWLTIERGKKKKKKRVRLSRYPILWGVVEGMRAALTGDLATLQKFYAIEMHGTRDDWELVLIPRHKKMRDVVRLVSIRGEQGRIRVIEMVETTGDRSVTHVVEDAL